MHLLEDLVFLSQALVKFKVINKVFLAMLAQKVKFDVAGVRSPLKVEKGRSDTGQFGPAGSRVKYSFDKRVVVASQ